MGPPPSPPDDRPTKRAAFQAFLQEGFVSIHLDARRPGVVVPTEFAGSPHLVLQYGLHMPIPIPDLELTDDSVSATLSFARQPLRTTVPWSAIYIVACEDGRGVLYYEDVPEEVSLVARPGAPGGEPGSETMVETAEVSISTPDGAPISEVAPQDSKRFLKSIPLEPEVEAGEALDEDDESKTKRRRRPTLRLVK